MAALRDKLVERAQPYLEPGEQVQAVFTAQTGPSPYWVLLSSWIVIFSAGYSVVVVTDRAIVVLRASRWAPSKPKALRMRGPRAVWLGPVSGLWDHIMLDRRYWVHKRFHKDVMAADQALYAMQSQGQVQVAPAPYAVSQQPSPEQPYPQQLYPEQPGV